LEQPKFDQSRTLTTAFQINRW